MMGKKLLFMLSLLLSLLLAAPTCLAEGGLYVKKTALPENFILGMDVSSVLSLEKGGVRYFDLDGQEKDLFEILHLHGVNYIRVRVWNDPFDSQGRGYGGGNCDIEAAIEIGKRATAQGMKLLVDFHYSDFWADPAKQQTPKAWEGMKIDEKADALYAYTLDCLTRLKNAGVDVGMVQLGNETNGKLCGEKIWKNIVYKLMAAGSRAVREADPNILIAVHFANPENADNYMSYASKLDYYHLDYDVFATSYYPYWHGTLDNLKAVLSSISTTYGKQVMVAETSYAYTPEDTDWNANTIGEGGGIEKPWPFTVQGQANEVQAVCEAMADIGGLGVFYWEGAWISAGGANWEENHALWEQNGSGWASSYAAEYDPKDAGKYYGGSACDNQAMFDPSGHALPSLQVFELMRTGQEVPLAPDAIADTNLMFDLSADIALPDTVSAIMNDGSTQALPVAWEAYDPEAMRQGGEQSYVIKGEAGGMEATCYVNMVKYNFLTDYSFEEGGASWQATDLGGTEQLYVEEKKSDSLTGTKHYHFYSAAADAVAFKLEQEVRELPAGVYSYEISIMGGDGGETDIFGYVLVNGEEVARAESEITEYNAWHTARIPRFEVREGDTVTVGISVRCKGAGAWGKIDDAKLNRVE